MVLTPLRALLFVAAAVVAAAGTAFYAGAFDAYLGETAKQVASLSDGAATRNDAGKASSKDDRVPAKATGEGGEAGEKAGGASAKSGTSDADETDDAAAGDKGKAGTEASAGENEVVIPTFAVVRVEPDGSLVIAGSAAPDSHVEVVAGATIIGEATAGPAGDFAVVLDDPLEAGDYQIVLRATSSDGLVATSKETAVVSVPDSPDGQVLALVEQPGEPSRLITVPEGEEADKEVASAEPGSADEGQSGSAGDDGQKATPKGGRAAGGDASGEAVASSDGVDAATDEAGSEDGRERKTAIDDTRDGNNAAGTGPSDESADGNAIAADETSRTRDGNTDTGMASGEGQGTPAGETGAQKDDRPVREDEASPAQDEARKDVGSSADRMAAAAREKKGVSVASEDVASQREDTDDSDAGMDAVQEDETQGAEAGRETLAPAPEKRASASGERTAASEDLKDRSAATAQRNADRDKAGSQSTVFIEAVEIDRDKIFVAGISEPGKRVRVYANEILLGDATVAPNGRFLVEATRDLPVGDYIVRADLLAENGADVIARAAVPFERQPGEKIAAVAPREKPASGAGNAEEGSEASPKTNREPAVAAAGDAQSGSSPGQSVAANGNESATGRNGAAEEKTAGEETANTASSSGAMSGEPSSGDEPVGSQMAVTGEDTSSSESVAGGRTMSSKTDAKPGPSGDKDDGTDTRQTSNGTASSDTSDGEDTSMAMADAPSPTPAESDAESAGKGATSDGAEGSAEMRAGTGDRMASAGSANDMAIPDKDSGSASGPAVVTAPKLQPVDNAVIIRRGDTLWQISRRVYGRGIRYTNIYLANQSQIRNPHWIWPGQVFAVPDKTQEGVPADMTAIGDQAVPMPDRIESRAE